MDVKQLQNKLRILEIERESANKDFKTKAEELVRFYLHQVCALDKQRAETVLELARLNQERLDLLTKKELESTV